MKLKFERKKLILKKAVSVLLASSFAMISLTSCSDKKDDLQNTDDGYYFDGFHEIEAVPNLENTQTDLPAVLPEVVEPSELELDCKSVILEQDKKFTLSVREHIGGGNIVWRSGNPGIVTVKDGVVTGVAPGVAVIYAVDENGKTASCRFEIKPCSVESLKIDKSYVILKQNKTFKLNAQILPESASGVTVTWKSSDDSVVTVENGVITAKKPGIAQITASVPGGKSDSCKVEVTDGSVTGVKLNYRMVLFDVGQKFTLKAQVLPEGAKPDTVVWKSTNEKVVTVKDGVVTAVGPGKAYIEAHGANDTFAKCHFEVRSTSPENQGKLSLNVSYMNLPKGQSGMLKAYAGGRTYTDRLFWSSSDHSVCTVSRSGRVYAMGRGTAYVTAATSDGRKISCKISVGEPKPEYTNTRAILNSAPLHPVRTGVPEVDSLVDNIFAKIFTSGMDTWEKTRAIFDYLIEKVTYGRGKYYWTDFDEILGGRKYAPRDREVILRAYDILTSNVGVCNDYSAAFMVMTRALGLECYYIEGKTTNIRGGYSGHMWNNIKINGVLYTFDVQVEANVAKRSGGVIPYTRFCKTDEQIGRRLICFYRNSDIKAYQGFKFTK